MTLTQLKYQAIAIRTAIVNGKCKNKHSAMGKYRQLQQRIREAERFNNNQNWLGQ